MANFIIQTNNGTLGDGDDTITEIVQDNGGNGNEPPTVNDAAFTVPEDASAGTDVGQVEAEDDGTVEAFDITNGNADVDGDDNNAFAIDDSGQITVADADDLVADSDNDPFSLSVTATDDEGATSDPATVEVDIESVGDTGLPPLDQEEVDAGTDGSDNINGDQDGATLSGGAGTDRFQFDNIVNDQGDPQQQSVTIDDFAEGEQLFFEGGFSSGDIAVENQSATDGQVVLGIRNTDITITGLSEQDDGSILGVSGFEDVFGDQALGFA